MSSFLFRLTGVDVELFSATHRCDNATDDGRRECVDVGDFSEEDALELVGWKWFDGTTEVGAVTSENFAFQKSLSCGRRSVVHLDAYYGASSEKVFQLNEEHTLKYFDYEKNATEEIVLDSICLFYYEVSEDYYAEYEDYELSGETYYSPVLLTCVEEGKEPTQKILERLYPPVLFLSCFFTLITFIVYIMLKELRKNLFGKLLTGFLANLCLNFFLNGISHSLPERSFGSAVCIAFGYCTYYTFISFFLWMNALAVNLVYKE